MSLLRNSKTGPPPRRRRPLDLVALRNALEAETPCGFFFKHLQFENVGGKLVVTGKLPNYALHKHLQTRLVQLTGGFPIEDRTMIVNAQGLSSNCAKLLSEDTN